MTILVSAVGSAAGASVRVLQAGSSDIADLPRRDFGKTPGWRRTVG